MKKRKKNFIKIAVHSLAIIYIVYTFFSQQKVINQYKEEAAQYEKEIAVAEEEKARLCNIKDNIDSLDYIEKVAREKLGMYMPNERAYIDVSK